MLPWIFLSVIVTTSATPLNVITTKSDEDLSNYRLPETTVPSKYELNLSVSRTALEQNDTTYSGTVNIDFQVTEETDRILLHSAVSNISSITITDWFDESIDVSSLILNSTTEILTIVVSSDLSVLGDYTLQIDFTGTLNKDTRNGFQRIAYTENGKEENVVVTKLEPTYARRYYPCFDEPQYKATFVLTLNYPSDYNSLSNTPVESTITSDDIVTATFEETPLMSTYLLAFSISKFVCSSSTDNSEMIPIQVCTKASYVNKTGLALNYINKFIDAFGDYTLYSYSDFQIGKLDQIGVISSPYAMENWGFILYPDRTLVSDNETSESNKQDMLTIIAHETSHQWFGDLVTTKWWNSTFLNEGFAEYFNYAIFNEVGLDDWEMDKHFVVVSEQWALLVDLLDSAVSLTSQVWTQDEIEDKFNYVSYNKGSAILRMIASIIGEDNFQSSLRLYIAEKEFSSATPDNLWSAINFFTEEDSLPENLEFSEVIDNWVNKPGYPLVNVTLNGSDVILSQERFVPGGTDDTQWYVPITYITSHHSSVRKTWLEPGKTLTLSNVVPDNNTWIIVNPETRGFYRVLYDSTLRGRIVSTLKSNHTKISDINRAQIVDDVIKLTQYEYVTITEMFDLLDYLVNETSHFPWASAFRDISHLISSVYDDEDLVDLLFDTSLVWVKHMDTNMADQDWSNTDHLTAIKLGDIWFWACNSGSARCKNESVLLLDAYRVNGTSVNPNVRHVVYCNGLRYSSNYEANYAFLSDKLNNSNDPHEVLTLRRGLRCTPYNLKRYLEEFINNTFNTAKDFSQIWSIDYSRDTDDLNVFFDVFVNNHSMILKKYQKAALDALRKMIERFTTDEQIKKLEQFINQLEKNSMYRTVSESALNATKHSMKRNLRIKTELRKHFGLSN